MHDLVSSSQSEKAFLNAINILFFKVDLKILELSTREAKSLIYLIES